MAQGTTDLVPRTWTQLSAGDITTIRVANLGPGSVHLQATVGATPPNSVGGAISLLTRETIPANLTLADLWPGVPGATRIYAWADDVASVSWSHA